MATMTNILLPIAKVVKSFGFKGGMIIRYSPSFVGEIDKERPVFIAYDGLPVPFFIDSIENRGANQAILHLDGIENSELVEEIMGESLLIKPKSKKEEQLIKESAQHPSFALIGYKALTEEGVVIGTITKLYEYPGNPCLGISKEDKEILLPMHQDFIVSIESKNSEVIVKIPKGLLEL